MEAEAKVAVDMAEADTEVAVVVAAKEAVMANNNESLLNFDVGTAKKIAC